MKDADSRDGAPGAKGTRKWLHLSEDNFRIIFENSAVAITVTDKDENIVTWNKFAESLFGMNPDELYMKPVRALYPGEEWRKIRSQNIRQKGMQHHLETRVVRNNGEIIDVDISLSVLKGPDGEVTGSIGVIKDITERKKMERALKQSEELSRGIIETAATGIYILEEGRFKYANRLMEEISGYTSEEFIGTSSVSYIHPDDRDYAREKAIEALKGHSSLPYEFRCIRKDLEIVWVSERVISIEYGGGRAVIGTIMDITERKLAEKARQEHTRRVETLLSVGTTMGETIHLPELLKKVLEKVFEVIPAGAGGVFLSNEETGELELMAHRGLSDDIVKRIARMNRGRGFAGRVSLTGKPVVTGAGHEDERFAPAMLGLKSLCSVPVLARDRMLGVMFIGSYSSEHFPDKDVRLLISIASQIGIAIENAQLYERTAVIALTDDLTGLYNFRYMMEQMDREYARAIRKRTPLSLIMIDMDGLKGINDRFGHQHGSAFLKQLGTIIRLNTRASDVAARMGGDEFILLAPETGVNEAREIAERLRVQAESYRADIDGWEVRMSISVGIASYPNHAQDIKSLMARADEAMYTAKRAGKNRVATAVVTKKRRTGTPSTD